MVRIRTTKLASNPRRRNARRRKMSPKQVAIFGTKRQKAALKAARRRKRASAPARRVKVNSKPRRRSVARKPNSALVLTLGPIAANPRGGKSRGHERRTRTVAAKTKRRTASKPRRRVAATSRPRRRTVKANKRYRSHARRSAPNPKVIVRYRTRRRSVNRHRSRPAARNPSLFGMPLTGKSALTLVGGGLVGVAAAKFIPTLLPANRLTDNNIGRVVVTGASAFAAGWLAGRVSPAFGGAVLFGGLMQTGSVALNAFLPGFSIGGVPFGLGELMPGQFSVPQNPLRLPPPAPAPPTNARIGVNGLARAYGSAF